MNEYITNMDQNIVGEIGDVLASANTMDDFLEEIFQVKATHLELDTIPATGLG